MKEETLVVYLLPHSCVVIPSIFNYYIQHKNDSLQTAPIGNNSIIRKSI